MPLFRSTDKKGQEGVRDKRGSLARTPSQESIDQNTVSGQSRGTFVSHPAMEDLEHLPGVAQDIVHTGDIILLSVRKSDGLKCYLAGEGIVLEDLFVFTFKEEDPSSAVTDIRDCLFRVVHQLCYTALKELLRHTPGKDTADELAVLHEKVRQEESQNEAKIAMRSAVRYGDVLQLQHVKSGKYLTVVPKQTARQERDARRVALQRGGAHSAFLVQPFYKYKAVGEPLLYDEQVLLSSQKLGHRWIFHASLNEDSKLPGSNVLRTRYEVNCSTDTSGCFFPILFSRGSDHLQYSHVVRITYPQCDRVVGASCTLGAPKRPFMRRREGDTTWAKGTWLLETPEMLHGGDVKWALQTSSPCQVDTVVCLRHLGTGFYLSVDRDCRPTWALNHKGRHRICPGRLVKERDTSCHFMLDVLEDSVPGDHIRLGSRGLCKALLRFEDGEGPMWLSCEGTHVKKQDDKRPRPSLELYFGDTRRIRDAVIIECLTKTESSYVASLTSVLSWKATFLSASKRLKELTHVKEPENSVKRSQTMGLTSEVRVRDTRELFEEIEEALVASIRFTTQTTEQTLEDPLHNCPHKSWPFAQRLVREVKFLDACVGLMDALWQAGYKVYELTARTMVRLEGLEQRPPKKTSDLNPLQLRCLKLLIELWRCCFQDNRENENYFFRKGWLEKINDLNGLGLGAAACLAALVSNNKLLLQGVKVETLQKFIQFICDLGPDMTWLKFMKAVCSCEGHAIANKQQQVLQMMYYPGAYATPEEWSKWGGNRRHLFLAVKLSNEAKGPFLFPESAFGNGEFPGKSIVRDGIREVWVSWTTNMEPWELRRDWLYFHPVHLGLPIRETEATPEGERFWVSLADIAWVLSPDYTYEVAHPDDPNGWKNDKEKIRQRGTFKARENLSKYFVAQTDLMQEMCLDYQVNAMNAVQDEYSFDLLCCALWDHTLAPIVRCSFCGLLNNLWVNRHPHLEAQLVPICHLWEELGSATPGDLWLPAFELDPGWLDDKQNSAFDRHPSSSKFNMLVAYVGHHLVTLEGRMVHSHEGSMSYTAEVVRLLRNLLQYGFVAEEDQLVRLLRPMLACLDGRTDWLECNEVNLEAVFMARKASGRSIVTAHPTLDDGTESLPESNTPLLCSTWRSSNSESSAGGAEDSMLLCNPCWKSHGESRSGGGIGGRRPLYFQMPEKDDGATRYPAASSAKLVDAKVLMCEVCATVMEIAVGNGVAQLARLFSEHCRLKGVIGNVEITSQEVGMALKLLAPQQFDFDLLSGTSFNTLLLDLMMYESPKLFVAAAKVMRLWNRRVAETFERASEIIILGDAAEGEMYKQMKRHVARLSNLINTNEDWGISDALGPINTAKCEDAKRLLEQIRFLCSQGNNRSDSEVPDERMQSLLSSLRLGEELIHAFYTPYEDFHAESEGVLHQFMHLVCKLLHQFVNGHPRNQQFFYKHLDKIAEWNGRDIGTAIAISGIFRGNRTLCESISESIVYEVGQALVRARGTGCFLPPRLDFLQSIVVAGQRPIVRNKEIVLNMLKNPYYAKVLHLLEGKDGFKRRGELLRRFHSWRELEKPGILRVWEGGDGELEYHKSCLNLLSTLCVGRDESGASAFVQAKCPPKQLVDGYLDISTIQTEPGCTEECRRMCASLKRTILRVVETVYYDTDLKDEVFYSSQSHLWLLDSVLEELQQLQGELSKAKPLGTMDEELLFQILRFFNALVEFTPHTRWHQDLAPLLNSRLQPMLTELAKPKYTVGENNPYFKAAVSRALGWLTEDYQKKQQRLTAPFVNTARLDRSNQLTEACKEYVGQLREHDLIKEAMEKAHERLISDVRALYENTNPGDPAYQKEKDAALAEGRPVRGGFRRNCVSMTAFVQRAISHCLEADHLSDWATTSFVITTISDVLSSLADEKEELQRMQLTCAQGGAERLVIDTLCARPNSQLVRECLLLAEHLLKPNNKDVQEVFVTYFHTVDDSDLWHLFREMIEAVSMNVKPVRLLKRIARESGKAQVLTVEESELLHMFSDNVRTLERVLQFLQLLCEGHNSPVQRYIFQQVDNSASINLLDKIKGLCLKICKNEAAADLCDFEDIDILTTCFELLVEATTRPDPRNQLFLSTSGIVEGILKMLHARFLILRHESAEEAGDCYPTEVRSLKAQVTLLLLVLLELRQDQEVHRTLVIRTDATLLKRRLIFVHRWFLASKLKLGSDVAPHLCSEDGSCILDDLAQDDGIEDPDSQPSELLEGYLEEDLIDFFDEAFNIMLMIRELRPWDEKFRNECEPNLPVFDKALQLRLSSEAYAQAKGNYDMARKYSNAYHFFNEWIKMVEVCIDGNVFDLYFRMPVLCNYILGSEKEAILNEVPVEPPEAKIKEFIGRCSNLYEMTTHTRKLSSWSPAALAPLRFCNGGKHPRPLLFFLKKNSANLTRTSYVCLGIAILLNALLFNGLALPEGSDKNITPDILDESQRTGTWCAGVLYVILTVVQFLVVCLTYTPIDHENIYQESLTQQARLLETFLVVAFGVLCQLAAWLPWFWRVLATFSTFLVAGMMWQPDWNGCPRNVVARAVVTAYAGFRRQQILRRLFLLTTGLCAVTVVEFCYTFLLLDVLFIFEKLQNIIKAVIIPIDSLALTMMVGGIIMYEYAVIAFYYFRDDYGESCKNMVDCTMTTIYLGLREDIGQNIDDVKSSDEYSHWYGRVVFDLTFFVLITTVLMNILFGIIVDTFGALRDQVQQRESYKKNTTFISSLERSEIDKAARAEGILSGFDHLENERQNCWNYMNFVFYLKRKDPINYSGPETRINMLILEEDISWLPIYTCSLLQRQEKKKDSEEAKAKEGDDCF